MPLQRRKSDRMKVMLLKWFLRRTKGSNLQNMHKKQQRSIGSCVKTFTILLNLRKGTNDSAKTCQDVERLWKTMNNSFNVMIGSSSRQKLSNHTLSHSLSRQGTLFGSWRKHRMIRTATRLAATETPHTPPNQHSVALFMLSSTLVEHRNQCACLHGHAKTTKSRLFTSFVSQTQHRNLWSFQHSLTCFVALEHLAWHWRCMQSRWATATFVAISPLGVSRPNL